MNMRLSRVLKKLRAGETATCFKINLGDARAVEIAALAGFDCLWTCLEHVPNDLSVMEQCIWAAKAHDTDVLVRTARGGYSNYIRPLELDAAGIMVPHCMGVEDAKEIVRMTRFHPVGCRPVDGGNADGAYCGVEFNDYLKQANTERFVVLQIEDTQPLKELDAIAALDGIDMLFFGPGDFSQSIGAPGQWDHPEIAAARRQVAEAAIRHGKYAGTVGSTGNYDELVAMGYRFISMGADVVGLSNYCQSIISAVSKKKASSTDSIYSGD